MYSELTGMSTHRQKFLCDYRKNFFSRQSMETSTDENILPGSFRPPVSWEYSVDETHLSQPMVVRTRIRIVAIWALVAVAVGARVVSSIPVMKPFATAQFMASTA